MAKKYFYTFLLLVGLATTGTVFAQEKQSGKAAQETNIDGLTIYPNPVSGDRIYITTKLNEDKEIVIFDVLGKKVLQTVLTSKELNIGTLNPGIYIIQVKEADAVATRKLIVK
jgi:hypothetical protein